MRIGFLLLMIAGAVTVNVQLPALKISDNHRFLVTADGKPFSGWAIRPGNYSID